MPYLAYSLKSSIEKYYFRNQISKPFFTDFRLAKLKPFSSKSRPSKPPRPPIFSPNRRKKHQKRAGFRHQNPRSRPAPTEYLITRSGRFARSRLRRRRKRKCQAAPRPAPAPVTASLVARVALNPQDRRRLVYLMPRMHDRA